MNGDVPELEVGASTMTRRQLLRRFGMIGGSSLVMGAMNAWDLMATPAGPRPEWRGNRADTTVLILGAGISGLVVGYELGKLGYDYRILEARERVGGLAWSVRQGHEHTELGDGGERQVCRFDAGQYFNAGPWRIPHEHRAVLDYCKELGVRVEQFIDENLVLFAEDRSLGQLSNRKVYLRELRADMWGHTTELLAKAVNKGSLDDALTTDDKERLLQFLVRAGYLNGPDQLYVGAANVRGADGGYDLDALLRTPFINQVRSVNAGTGGPDPVFQPTGGMAEIAFGFERVVGDRITRGAEVESVRQTEDLVRVVYRDTRTGERTELTADYVVSCLPMTILKKLDVNFSSAMATVVNETNHSPQAKMGLQMKRRFWEEDDGIYGGHLVYIPQLQNQDAAAGGGGGFGGPNPLPQFSYPSNDYHAGKGVLLGYYGNGRMQGADGRSLAEVPVAARIEHVLASATRVHPQMREEFENAYAVWWERVPYSEGAWASNPGVRLEQLSTADGRIYIGSAAASTDPAWLEGAVTSAWRTVDAIHTRVGQA